MGKVGRLAGGLARTVGLVPDAPKVPSLPQRPDDLRGAAETIAGAADPESADAAARRRRRAATSGQGFKDTILTSPLGLPPAATQTKTLLGE